MPTCNVCGITYADPKQMSNRATTCSSCIATGVKWCTICHSILPISAFGKNGKTIRSSCMACTSRTKAAQQKRLRDTDPIYAERMRVYFREHDKKRYNSDPNYRIMKLSAKHKRRGVDNARVPLDVWQDALQYFDHRCAYCGDSGTMTLEHVIPVSAGGSNTIANVIPACEHCNKSKNNKPLDEWYSKQLFFSTERLNRILRYIEEHKDQ